VRLQALCYDNGQVFSSRLKLDLRPNPLSVLLAEKRRAGAKVLDLTGSNPTVAGFHYPEEEILGALADRAALRYDPAPRGLLAAREAVSRYYAERGREVPASRILLTASTSEAYAYLFKLLTNPADEVLVPRPSYPLFEFLATLESVVVKQYALRYDGAWHIDFDSLERAASERTRAAIVVNPNNPTGSFLKSAEAGRLGEFAARRGIAILIDEVFSDYALSESASRAPLPPGDVPVFSMSGLSKIAGLPQMKLGWIVADGPRHEESIERLEWIADTYLSVSSPVQLALPKLLELSGQIRAQIRRRTAANLTTLRLAAGQTPASVLNVEGGWCATLQVPRTRSEEEWALTLLRDREVLTQPGFFYDFESEAFLVLSLLTDPEALREGVRRILSLMV
jgi:alanine-synthesizing transaminase